MVDGISQLANESNSHYVNPESDSNPDSELFGLDSCSDSELESKNRLSNSGQTYLALTCRQPTSRELTLSCKQ